MPPRLEASIPAADDSKTDCELFQLTAYCRLGEACQKAHRKDKPSNAQATKVAATLKRGMDAYAATQNIA